VRTKRDKDRATGNSQPRICASIEEGIDDECAELGLLDLHSKVQRCGALEAIYVVDVATLVFE
jgi:hypothetical protein